MKFNSRLRNCSSLQPIRCELNPICVLGNESGQPSAFSIICNKKAAELLAHSKQKTYDPIVANPQFLTVVGPAGRPSSTSLKFVKRIEMGSPGKLKRTDSKSENLPRFTTTMAEQSRQQRNRDMR